MSSVYAKRDSIVEAMQWDGTNERAFAFSEWIDWAFTTAVEPATGSRMDDHTAAVFVNNLNSWIPIKTGDWVIHTIKGKGFNLTAMTDNVFNSIYMGI